MDNSAAQEAGYLAGQIAFPLLLVAGGVYLGRRLGRRRNPPGFVAWPVLVAIVLAFLGIYGSAQRAAERSVSVETPNG